MDTASWANECDGKMYYLGFWLWNNTEEIDSTAAQPG